MAASSSPGPSSPPRSPAKSPSAYSTRGEWESDLREHRAALRQAIEDEEGLTEKEKELSLDEEEVYAPISALSSTHPPKAAKGPSGWIYHSTSLGCLLPHHLPRRLAIATIEYKYFDPLILLTIMCNCTTMAWSSPLDALDPSLAWKAALLAQLEWVYLAIFTFELVNKIVAYGFVGHTHSYLRDPWCILDFVVVSLAWLPILFPQFGNMSAIRSVRALRPLRALKRVPGMPVLVGSILQSMPALGNVAGLTAFLFLVFGIVGMNLFKGSLHYRCADPAIYDLPDPSTPIAPPAAAAPAARALFDASRRLSGRALKGGPTGGGGGDGGDPQAAFDSGVFCANDPNMCADTGEVCFYFAGNAGSGTVSFESVAMTFIPILQVVTFDTWTDPMFELMAAYSEWSWVYFILIAILGGLFVVNLFLAVIFDEFMRAQAGDEAEQEVTSGVSPRGADGGADDVTGDDKQKLLAAGGELSDGVVKDEEAGTARSCCDCAPDAASWRATVRDVMLSDLSGNISTGFVVFNLVIMCLPYAGQPHSWEMIVEGLSSFVTWIFIFEMAFKLIGMGCADYWSDGWNQLDGTIVSLSLIEILITIFLADTGINISFLRMLRLLRLLRLLKAWPALYKIVMAFVKAVPQISNLFVLMFLMMFIFALLGMQTFGGTGVGVDSRWHFDYFYTAMLTVFAIFTGAWVDAFQVCSSIVGLGVSVAFFIPGLIIGFFIIMNLFIAILLEAFAEEEEEEEEDEVGEGAGEGDAPTTPPPVAVAPPPSPSPSKAEPEPLEGDALGCLTPENPFRNRCRTIAEAAWFDQVIILLIVASSICLALDVPRVAHDSSLFHTLKILNYFFTACFIGEMCLKIISYGFCFTPNAYLKSGWNILDFTIVMISILGLFAELIPAFGRLKALRILRVLRPLRLLQRNPGMKLIITSLIKTMPSVGNVFAVVLVFHIVFTILGMQLFGGKWGACTDESITTRAECYPHRQLSDAADASVVNANARLPASPAVRSLRASAEAGVEGDAAWLGPATRALATARAATSVALVEGGEDAAEFAAEVDIEEASRQRRILRGRLLNEKRNTMFKSWYRDGREERLSLLAASEGQQQRVDAVHPRSGRALKGGPTSGGDGPQLPTQWLNPPYGSFDDFQQSMLILYIAATGDGWEEFMWMGMDSVAPGVAPVRNDSSPASIFFLAWMIVGCFISINLFVGAIVDNFTRIKQESDGSATMTPEQQQWVDTLKATVSGNAARAPHVPTDAARKVVFDIVTSRPFDMGVISVIVCNVLAMSLEYDNMEATYASSYYGAMLFFSYFYYCECILKIIGLGEFYFADGWCRFDFFLVCTSLLDQFASELLRDYLPIPPTILRVMRVARVLRVLRLLKNLKGLRDLVMTLVFAFPGLMNVGALLGLVIFVYAVLGLNLFTFVMPGGAMAAGRDFVTFGNACLLLFQCLTGDGWSELMNDALVDEHRGCDPLAVPTDCGSPIAVPYFISFTIIGSFVMLNLVVAVILENFTALGNVNSDLVSTNDIVEFKEAWGFYDPDADGMIPVKSLPLLLVDLPPPLGLKGTAMRNQAFKVCLSLGLTQKKNDDGVGEVAFKQVLDALVQRNFASKNITGGGEGEEPPPAVQEALMARADTMGEATSLEKMAESPGKLGAPLTPRRFEMSKILAEEIFCRYLRERNERRDAKLSPSMRKAKSAPATMNGSGSPSLGKSMPIPKPLASVVLASGGTRGQAPVPEKGRNGSPMPPAEKSKKGAPPL